MATSLNQNEKGLWIISGISFGNCDGAIPDVPGNLKVPVTLYWPEKGQNPVRIEIEKTPKDVETTWITDMGQDKPDSAQLDRDMDSGATILGEKRYIVRHIDWCRDCTFDVDYIGGTVSSGAGKTSAFKITKAEGMVLEAYSLNNGPAQTIENDTLAVSYPANESETEIVYGVKVSATSEDCGTKVAETEFRQYKKEAPAPDCDFEIEYTGDTVSSAAGTTNAFRINKMPDDFNITSYTIFDDEYQITGSDLMVEYPENPGAARDIVVTFKGNSTECGDKESNAKIRQEKKEDHEPDISYNLLLNADKQKCPITIETGEMVTFEVFFITLEDGIEVNREKVTEDATFTFTGDSYYTTTQYDNVIRVKNEGSETGTIEVEATYEINGTVITSNTINLCVKGKDEPGILDIGTIDTDRELIDEDCVLTSEDSVEDGYVLPMCGVSDKLLFELTSKRKETYQYQSTPYTAYTDGSVICGDTTTKTETKDVAVDPTIWVDESSMWNSGVLKYDNDFYMRFVKIGDGPEYEARVTWGPCCYFDYDYVNGQELGNVFITNDIDGKCSLVPVIYLDTCTPENYFSSAYFPGGGGTTIPYYSFAISPDPYIDGRDVNWETTFDYTLKYQDLNGEEQVLTATGTFTGHSNEDGTYSYSDTSGFNFERTQELYRFETTDLPAGMVINDLSIDESSVKTTITSYTPTPCI